MDLRQLRYFVALAETGNFRRAAARLHISQPPLTVAIRKLEEELGTPLFERSARGATLTAAAEAALPMARAALAEVEQFRAAVRGGADGARGRLRIGFVGSATFDLLPRLVPPYRRRFPLVELVLEEASSVAIVSALDAREMDVGIVRLPLLQIAPIETRVIDRDELHVAVPADSGFARADRIDLKTLAAQPFIFQSRVSVLHAISLMACHDAGFTPIIAQEATQQSAMLSLVRSGLGVALVPGRAASAVPQAVRLIPLERRVPIETGIALPTRGATPQARRFADLADSLLISNASNSILDR